MCVFSHGALPPPSSVHLQRHSRATFSNCILPLATAQRQMARVIAPSVSGVQSVCSCTEA